VPALREVAPGHVKACIRDDILTRPRWGQAQAEQRTRATEA